MNEMELDIALRRLTNRLRKQATSEAGTAAAGAVSEASDAARAAVDEHAQQRQFVHGVGPLYVAKTSRADQFVDWKDLRGTPPPPGGGGVDPATLEIGGEQITTGVVPILRLPVAGLGEVSSSELVRADDPRLNATLFRMITSEYLAAGDFVVAHEVGGQPRVRRASADQVEACGAIGFVSEAVGSGEEVVVAPVGENAHCYLPGVTTAHLGRLIYLSSTPGKASFSPPSAPGQLIQSLGSVVGIVSSTVAIVLVRYEFRFRL